MAFNTVFPPNGPACTNNGNNGDQQDIIIPPNSRHPGGVMGSLADGSVRFFSDTIDCGNLAAYQSVPGGPSMYGVWGSFGSVAGGDITQQD